MTNSRGVGDSLAVSSLTILGGPKGLFAINLVWQSCKESETGSGSFHHVDRGLIQEPTVSPFHPSYATERTLMGLLAII